MKLSIVAFLADPLASPDDDVRRICHAALDADVNPTGTDSADHRYEISHGGQMFSVECSGQRYAEPVTEIEDTAVSDAYERHRGWLKFAWVEQPNTPEFGPLFTPIARLAAAACAGGAIALYQPYWERFAPVTEDTIHDLSSDQPLRAFGIVHSNLGCLVRDDTRWKSLFPTRWGPIEVDAYGGPHGPAVVAMDRMREIAEHRLRGFRARLLVSLMYRPCRIVLDAEGEISVEFRNWLTGTRSHFVSERNVAV